MKRLIALVLAALLAAPVSAYDSSESRTPTWFRWTAGGVAVGLSSLYLAKDAHRWRRDAIADGQEGDRIWAAQGPLVYGLTYQERARSHWDARARVLRHALHVKQFAVALGVGASLMIGYGITVGLVGDRVTVGKAVRFGGARSQRKP